MDNPPTLRAEMFTHPEIELRLKKFPVPIEDWRALSGTTLVDTLEVYSDGKITLNESLGSEEFLNGIDREALHPLGSTENAQDDTASIIHQTLGTPLSFFRFLTHFGSSPRVGRSLFVRKSLDGRKTSLDGIYQVSDKNTANWHLCHVWFSQSLDWHQTSNYVMHGVPPATQKLILECAKGKAYHALLRPFAVHAFIQDSFAHSLFREYVVIDNEIHSFETLSLGFWKLKEKDDVKKLLSLSRSTKMLLAHAERCRRTSEYLIASLDKNADLFAPNPKARYWEQESIKESLAQLCSRVDDLTSSALTLDDRIKYLIDMVYNEISQANNAINLDIAKLTTSIAIAAQNDSSSMITMAAVTMFFLPSTFIALITARNLDIVQHDFLRNDRQGFPYSRFTGMDISCHCDSSDDRHLYYLVFLEKTSSREINACACSIEK
ncbi:hypothetical protein CVT25_015883 [Psilocybe cyanescens]|uniref:Magnesium transporter n=1 Tax=Psilocybe cyanescens TaxID=93625 RepID=A0A409XII8_PSICY|nr:hypothetical protein CVT25_015883 [Psilocybe cyanescens]